MSEKKELVITTRDRVLRAWQNSTELVRDFEVYSKEIDEKEIARMFDKFAEDEGHHAAKLLELLHELS
ncbi:MAG: rubrerythrin [Oscillospiraceae bacterium]|nr:rubrerythrin [Oscillospiraceae bacterium]